MSSADEEVRPEEEEARELLAPIQAEPPAPSGELVERTMRRVRDELTARDLIDFSTSVLVLRFFVPILDLVMGTAYEFRKRKDRDA